jgi:Na+-driven multidrug efflux pump
MGLTGIGIAGAISFGLQLTFINLYTYHSKDIKFNVSICDPRIYDKVELKQFLNLAIPSVVIFWINWWIWEVILLVSGLISVNDQAN